MDTTGTAYRLLVTRAVELAATSPEPCDRAFWARYAANLGLHVSAEIEQHTAAQSWRFRRLAALSYAASHPA